ncbi:MAG: PEP-CTERM sorting domain-containing protein [Thiobacillus sp.]|nr:PEP-CTERM sorting domain-containing protein [Pseudomonadota bacterium]MDP2057093.1 PEP-CTERM sorting domain-containing protein [Thiobacillus sp.]
MKASLISVPSLASASALALLLGMAVTSAQAAVLAVNLADPLVASGTVSDGTNTVTFLFDQQQPSGTGVLGPFLRVQENGTEQGYNSTQANQGAYPFEEKFGIWTHDVLFSSLQIVDGVYNFVLDIGEPVSENQNQGQQSLLSLDGLKLYVTDTAGQNDDSTDGNGNADGILGTLLWDMDVLADNYILLDANRDGKPGNGVSDMLMQVPTSVFANVNPTNTPYFILWSRFGLQNASNSGSESFGTFEEWAQLGNGNGGGGGGGGNIPEPASLLLMGAGLIGFGLARRRKSA